MMQVGEGKMENSLKMTDTGSLSSRSSETRAGNKSLDNKHNLNISSCKVLWNNRKAKMSPGKLLFLNGHESSNGHKWVLALYKFVLTGNQKYLLSICFMLSTSQALYLLTKDRGLALTSSSALSSGEINEGHSSLESSWHVNAFNKNTHWIKFIWWV